MTILDPTWRMRAEKRKGRLLHYTYRLAYGGRPGGHLLPPIPSSYLQDDGGAAIRGLCSVGQYNTEFRDYLALSSTLFWPWIYTSGHSLSREL